MAARKGRAAARPDAAQDRRAAHESAYWHLTDVGILANFRFAPRAAIPQAASLLQQKSQNGFLGHGVKLNTRYNPAYVRFARSRHQPMSTVRHAILESPSDDQLWGPAMDPIHPL